MLVHHDPARKLWVDLDTPKEFSFGAMLFHIRRGEEEVPEGMRPKQSMVEPILFFSRLLTSAEKNYWPTKLEIAGFF